MSDVEKLGWLFTGIFYIFLPPIVSSVWYLLGNEFVDVLWAGTLAFLWLLVGLKVYGMRERKAVK